MKKRINVMAIIWSSLLLLLIGFLNSVMVVGMLFSDSEMIPVLRFFIHFNNFNLIIPGVLLIICIVKFSILKSHNSSGGSRYNVLLNKIIAIIALSIAALLIIIALLIRPYDNINKRVLGCFMTFSVLCLSCASYYFYTNYLIATKQ